MNDNPFIDIYKAMDSSELLDILDRSADYQPLAVVAAKLEIDNRKLTQEELEKARAKQFLRQQTKTAKQEKIREIENKVKSIGSSFADTINPIQKGIPSTDKEVRLISLLLGGLSLYQLFSQFEMLEYMLSDSSAGWDVSMAVYFLPLFLVPMTGFLFFLRIKWGWILAMSFFSYSALTSVSMFVMELKRKPSGFSVLDNMVPTHPAITYVLAFVMFAALMWVLCKKNIRVIYNIDTMAIFLAIGISLGFISLMIITMV